MSSSKIGREISAGLKESKNWENKGEEKAIPFLEKEGSLLSGQRRKFRRISRGKGELRGESTGEEKEKETDLPELEDKLEWRLERERTWDMEGLKRWIWSEKVSIRGKAWQCWESVERNKRGRGSCTWMREIKKVVQIKFRIHRGRRREGKGRVNRFFCLNYWNILRRS